MFHWDLNIRGRIDLGFKFEIEELRLDPEGNGEPWKLLEEGRDGLGICFREDYVECSLQWTVKSDSGMGLRFYAT